MNEFDRHERHQKFLIAASKAALLLEIMFYLLLVLSACFWWYGEPGTEIGIIGGSLSVVMLWVYTFNKLPSMGLNCIKHPRAIFFQLPLTLLATIGFTIAAYNT